MSCGRDCDWGQGCGFLPFGRASIASGYTPAAVPGRCPVPPTPEGEKGTIMQREKKTEIKVIVTVQRYDFSKKQIYGKIVAKW